MERGDLLKTLAGTEVSKVTIRQWKWPEDKAGVEGCFSVHLWVHPALESHDTSLSQGTFAGQPPSIVTLVCPVQRLLEGAGKRLLQQSPAAASLPLHFSLSVTTEISSLPFHCSTASVRTSPSLLPPLPTTARPQSLCVLYHWQSRSHAGSQQGRNMKGTMTFSEAAFAKKKKKKRCSLKRERKRDHVVQRKSREGKH